MQYMLFFKYSWLILNLILIWLILIRSPNEQSLQEIIGPLKLFDSAGSAEETLDNFINILILCYFFLGLISTSKLFTF
jgi:preprotein translocase subunit SecG